MTESRTPWFARGFPTIITQVGPIVVGFFVLLYFGGKILDFVLNTAAAKFATMTEDHHKFSQKQELTNHFLWAECHNSADLIQDENTRLIAHQRCQPESKRVAGEQSYLFSIPTSSQAVATLAMPFQGASDASSSSGSAFSRPPSPRAAEAIAGEQASRHRAALVRAGNDNVQSTSHSPSPLWGAQTGVE